MDDIDAYGTVRTAAGRGCRKDPMPVGTVVIRQRKKGERVHLARYIKVRDDGPPARRWILYARWWWERNKGQVPAGQIVLHLDGDELNDNPENFGLGTQGTKLVLAHRRDPEMSARNRRNASAGTAAFNRLAGKLNRMRKLLDAWWYPVLDNEAVILNVPFRRRKKLLAWFGADVTDYPLNGRAQGICHETFEKAGFQAVQGRDLRLLPYYQKYFCVDPALGLPSEILGPEEGQAGVPETTQTANDRIAALATTPIWRRAREAAMKDLSERK